MQPLEIDTAEMPNCKIWSTHPLLYGILSQWISLYLPWQMGTAIRSDLVPSGSVCLCGCPNNSCMFLLVAKHTACTSHLIPWYAVISFAAGSRKLLVNLKLTPTLYMHEFRKAIHYTMQPHCLQVPRQERKTAHRHCHCNFVARLSDSPKLGRRTALGQSQPKLNLPRSGTEFMETLLV